MVVLFRAFARRSARRAARRAVFTRRLRAWASLGRARLWSLKPLASATAALVLGQAALAAPDQHALPMQLLGERTLRGIKTYTFQGVPGQNSDLKDIVKTRDANGNVVTVEQTLVQSAKSGIYNWSSFDIGAMATFNIVTPGSGGSSLHRVVGGTKLSEIFGKLNSNGAVTLINSNGVMFGSGAQVNVRSLVASTLNISDSDYLSGLQDLESRTDPVYKWENLGAEGAPSTFDHPTNYVLVDTGATIRTPSGGNVVLMARNVINQKGAVISTPGGQTALLGSEQVYVKTPQQEPAIYASEVNPSTPVLRGFLFELGGGKGEATNLGTILTERGNTTMMAHTVRQGGAIRATTSVQENGSVFLLARSGVSSTESVRADSTGTLILGRDSSIDITPDNSVAAGGSVKMTASRVELQGKEIVMESGASIKAPNANVNVRAESKPDYFALNKDNTAYQVTQADDARFVMQSGASIDVSGTTDTTVSVARNFVKTELLRNADLSSNPFLKDGALLNEKVIYDVRSAPAVLEASSHQGYKDSIQTTAGERMADGGQVKIVSTGGVLMQSGSTVDVSGGQVNVTQAVVSPTRLLGADGKSYTLNNARTDVQVVGLSTVPNSDLTRYGVVTQGAASSSKVEAGYVQGGNGGGLLVHAPAMVLDNQVRANVVQGERQRAGVDSLARQSSIALGLSMRGNLLQGLTLRAPGVSAPAFDWSNPLTASLPERSNLSADWFNASGAGAVSVATAGGLTIQDGANLNLQRAGSLTLTAAGSDGIYLGGDITGAGAKVSITTATLDAGIEPYAGGITLAANRRIDVAGDVVNQRRDGGAAGTALAGGSVSLQSAAGLDLQTGSVIDASGGATVLANNTVVGTRAGSVSLVANSEARDLGAKPVRLDGTLQARTLAGTTVKAANDVGDSNTGKLTLKVGEIDIVGAGAPALQKGQATDGFVLGSSFFDQGGFSQFDIDGVRRLTVASDARVQPKVAQWQARARLLNAATGSRLADNVTSVVQADNLAPRRSLALRASGFADQAGTGSLRLAQGAEINVGPRGSVTLAGGHALEVDGTVRAPGGSITTQLTVGSGTLNPDARNVGTYRFGATALLDVSGSTVLSATNIGNQRFGAVLDGGSIQVQAPTTLVATTPLVFEREVGADGTLRQATLKANGAQDVLDVRTQNSQGRVSVQSSLVASNGGSISVNAGAQGAVMGVALQAAAGGQGAQGGTLSASINDGLSSSFPDATLQIQQAAAPVTVTTSKVNGQDVRTYAPEGKLVLSADMVQQGGFANVNLKSSDKIETAGQVSMALPGDLTLDAPVLATQDDSSALLAAAGRLAWTNRQLLAPPASSTGKGSMTLRGGLIDVSGQLVTQGIDQLTLDATELRAHALSASRTSGGLTTGARQLTLDADQVNVATASQFTWKAAGNGEGGHALTITGGDRNAPMPLSAGGSLSFEADSITVDGVVRAPFGQITFKAPSITLTGNADVSVSGAGLSVPYGTTIEAGTTWQLNGVTVAAPPEKTVTFDTGTGELLARAGSNVDLSAGGSLLAWEFVPGPGGSTDIFKGTYESGTFAVVPTVTGSGGLDANLLAASGLSSTLDTSASRTITFGEGGPVPAGTYTVLPARYALLNGAYLVRRTTTTTPLAFGESLALNTGAVRVGASVGHSGGLLSAAPSATFEVLTREQALRFSEIKTTTFDDLLNAQASRQGVAPARRAMDAGTLNVAAQKVTLEGDLAFKRLTGGRGGELNVQANKVQVGGALTEAQAKDTLLLNVAQLNRTGVDSLLVGGLRQQQASDGSRLVDVQASEVTLANGGDSALTLGDVILAAKSKVTVASGAVLQASGTAQADDITVVGDGALVRASGDATAQSLRVGTDANPINRTNGEVLVADSARIEGGAVTIEGAKSTQISSNAQVAAAALTVGAGDVVVGTGTNAPVGALVVGGELLARLSQVNTLTLRGYNSIELEAGQGLSVQQALALDTPELKQSTQGSTTVTAGSLRLRNTSGATRVATTGTGDLNLQATGQSGQDGHIHFDQGVLSTNGFGAVNLQAAGSVVTHSPRELVTGTVAGRGSDNYAVATSEFAGNGLVTTTEVTNRAVRSGLSAQADVTVTAQSLTTGQGADGLIDAGTRTLSVLAGPASAEAAAAPSGLGGVITLKGGDVLQGGRVEATSGTVRLQASTGDVRFASGSQTLADGSSWRADGVTVPLAAGLIEARASLGNVAVQAGSLLSASAPAGLTGAEAGEVRLLAPQGQVSVAGDIRLLSDAGQRGGALKVDARTAPALDALVDRLNASARTAADQAGQAQARQNAARSFELQQRDGQNMVLSQDRQLVAQNVKLVADRAAGATSGGSIQILGQIVASGTEGRAEGGSVALHATGDLDVGTDVLAAGQPKALLDASATGQGQSGGQIELSSSKGVVRLNQQAELKAQGGTDGGKGGSLTLRAGVRAAGAPDGDQGTGNLRVAAIESSLVGFERFELQGEERTSVANLNNTVLTSAQSRSDAFQAAAATANTLGKVVNDKLTASVSKTITSSQVLQSTGDLTLDTDWNLTPLVSEASGSQFVVKPSAYAPMRLGILSAGNLNLTASLSAGLVNAPLPGMAQTASAAQSTLNSALVVAAAGLPLTEGSDINLVAGADLNSADVMATLAGNTSNLSLGSGTKPVFVRSTTGDVRLAAAGDVVLLNDRATVYTTGLLADASRTAAAEGFGTGNASATNFHTNTITRGTGRNTTRQMPFMEGGGSVSLDAGGSIRNDSASNSTSVSDWTYHKTDATANKSQSWWSRFDQFNAGVGTFGGGNITAQAGQDIVNTGFTTATSGFKGDDGAVRTFGGGRVDVAADGNLSGLLVKVGGDSARVDAGQNIDGTTERGGATLFYENTRMQVQAGQNALLDLVTEAGLQGKGASNGTDDVASVGIAGLGVKATLSLTAIAGDITLNSVTAPGVSTNTVVASLLPALTTLAAPGGDIQAAYLNQMPQAEGALLNVLAAADLKAKAVNVWANSPFGQGVVWGRSNEAISLVAAARAQGTVLPGGSFESGNRREPVRLVAQGGDLSVRAEVGDAVRMVAGGDVNLLGLVAQHQSDNDLSLVQAGRDLNVSGITRVRGPGDALLVAGRDVNITAREGVETNGSRENGALPDGSADLTVLAGVQPGAADYGVAESRFFHLLGGAGVAERPADLFAQLLVLKAGGPVPGLDSAEAQAFNALGFEQRLAAVRNLVGEAAFQSALLSHMQGRDANPNLGLNQALASVSSLQPREQAALLGSLLAPSWSQALAPEAQRSTAQAMAVARGGAYQQALAEYLARRTGVAAQQGEQALQAFDALSTEQRLVFTNLVLKNELNAAGTLAAGQKSAEAKLDAYQPGFNALATVFPGSKPTSGLLMGASSLKTQQNSDINVFTPHGGMNVGRLTGLADAEAAAKLGIVTTSGGDITGVVRDNVEVNQSRIFVVENGNMLLWASNGNIDAGKGSKTVTGAPAPVFRIVDGRLQVDTTGSFSGSGIAALDSKSQLNLFAPRGAIDAGEAGIRSGGKLTLDTPTVIGGNDIAVSGGGTLAPPPPSGTGASNLGNLGQSAAAAGPQAAEGPRGAGASKRRLLLDFLGFGDDKDEEGKK